MRHIDVDDLWRGRFELAPRHKKRRISEFCEAFLWIISNVHHGYKYTLDEIRTTRYWGYLQGYHPSWREKPLSSKADRQLRHRFWSGIHLYKDIRENGMHSPLAVVVEGGVKCLYRGWRRLVILKVLGVKIAEVKYAVVSDSASPE
jgi:hypothetical protein